MLKKIVMILAAALLLAGGALADGYETDVDNLALGPIQHHPGDPLQDNWYYVSLVGDAVTEIQDVTANPGRAFHLYAPATNGNGTQTSIARATTPPDLEQLPYITLSFDFYATTSDVDALNQFNSALRIAGGPHPGYMIAEVVFVSGNGVPKSEDLIDAMMWAYEPGVGNYAIPLTVGQNLAWDTWHTFTVVIDQGGDRYVSVTCDGETEDLGDHRPQRTFFEGEWLRGQLMESLFGEVVANDWGDPVVETDDHLYLDNLAATAERAPGAQITSITDVGNDQGRQVRMVWERSAHDAAGEPVITGYDIYRREDPDRAQGWDYVASVPACGDDIYQCVVPTLCDSTLEGGVCWSSFFVRAMTPDPVTFFDSQPDSGYSIDNLAPGVPGAFRAAYTYDEGNTLTWEESEAADFRYFNIYRGESADFEPLPENLIHQTTGIEWLDPTGTFAHHYKLAAVDFAGNRSEPTGPEAMVGAPGSAGRYNFTLNQNMPNPFNPSTTIRYTVPTGGGPISLEVFDIGGRLVRTLVTGASSEGEHTVTWRGRDDQGRELGSGVYLYRLSGSGFTDTKKMLLVK